MSLVPALDAIIRAMPKVELHVHLEGSIRPGTLLQLAKRHRVSLPADSVEGLREWFRFKDFEHFVEIYLTCSRSLRDPEDFQLVAREFLAEQAAQGVAVQREHVAESADDLLIRLGREGRDRVGGRTRASSAW